MPCPGCAKLKNLVLKLFNEIDAVHTAVFDICWIWLKKNYICLFTARLMFALLLFALSLPCSRQFVTFVKNSIKLIFVLKTALDTHISMHFGPISYKFLISVVDKMYDEILAFRIIWAESANFTKFGAAWTQHYNAFIFNNSFLIHFIKIFLKSCKYNCKIIHIFSSYLILKNILILKSATFLRLQLRRNILDSDEDELIYCDFKF